MGIEWDFFSAQQEGYWKHGIQYLVAERNAFLMLQLLSRSTTRSFLPHPSNLAEVLRSALSGLPAAIRPQRSGGGRLEKLVGQLDGGTEKFSGAFGPPFR